MKPAKVSVVIPTFNGEAYLGSAIESVLTQSFPDFELLISDDCSNDSTMDIVRRYASEDKRIKYWVNEENLGLFGNYNKALSNCTGDYIKCFSHDDILMPDALQRMTAELDARPNVALVTCASEMIDGAGEIIRVRNVDGGVKPGREVILENLRMFVNWLGEPCCTMFRREFLGDGFCVDYANYGDIEYWFRILLNGDCQFIPDVLCRYRWHDHNASHNNLRALQVLKDVWLLACKYEWLANEEGLSSEDLFEIALYAMARHVKDGGFGHEVALTGGWLEAACKDLGIPSSEILVRCLRTLGKQVTDATRQQQQARGPHFTRDWFSHNIPLWQGILGPHAGKPNLRFLEIGVLEGMSTHWLLTNILTHPTAHVVCIDTFEGSMEHQAGMSHALDQLDSIYSRFMQNVLPFGRKVHVQIGPSQELMRKLDLASFDFIYVDGSHHSADVLEDGILAFRLLKPGGILIFDDYGWTAYEGTLNNPRPGIDAFLAMFAEQHSVIAKGYQVAIQKN